MLREDPVTKMVGSRLGLEESALRHGRVEPCRATSCQPDLPIDAAPGESPPGKRQAMPSSCRGRNL